MQFRKYIIPAAAIFLFSACSKISNDDISFIKTATAPADGSGSITVSGDNSGMVTIKPDGAGVAFYDVYFGDTTTVPQKVMPGKSVEHKYAEGTYTVKVVSNGVTGQKEESSYPFTLTFRAPENVVVNTVSDVHMVTVSATADYATAGYKVYFGEDANEAPQMMAPGSFLTHNYANAGSYEVKVVALSGGQASTEVTRTIRIYDSLKLPITFEDPDVWYNWGDFGGSETKVITNPQKSGINTSDFVGQIIKKQDQSWAGNFIILSKPLDLTEKHVFKVKVYSNRIGMRVLMQLERNGDNTFQDNREVMTTKANAWEELTFDFSGVDNSKRLQNILFFLDNGTVGDGSANYTLLFDDIQLTN